MSRCGTTESEAIVVTDAAGHARQLVASLELEFFDEQVQQQGER